MKLIEKYSIGTGDRFGRQGAAQIAAFRKAREQGIVAAIVWNKSSREHMFIGSSPADQREAADRAICAARWNGPYHVDADHIGLATVERFAPFCDYFTLDVADFIGAKPDTEAVDEFMKLHGGLLSEQGAPARLDREAMQAAASRYLAAANQAGKIYRRIVELRGADDFITEVSMDETDRPQSPPELAVILAALADQGVPVQTIAPKFSGRFNKGVDYLGDLGLFMSEFEEDIRVVKWAPAALGLPSSLKLSIHSGSDKFSLYGGIGSIIRKHDAGIHLKTAGTTWLEEIVGLAESGGDGLVMAKAVYRAAFEQIDQVTAPYLTVVSIDRQHLPAPEEVERWEGGQFVAALRHDPSNPGFNPDMRQLVHVAFPVAAKMGSRYLDALAANEPSVSRNVTANLWKRHIAPLLLV
ncbi:MAG: tagaturonate epimerase family protein [Spirochaetaceae bacterium]|nr:tagaturonate epimerase family protein [Spirochaetaceae bacterium]